MKRFGKTLAAILVAASLQTQAQNLQFGGAVMNRDILMASDLASLTQPHAFGTARAMGMGGAFVSLGADMTSMSLNPAGLGMYRRNEVSFTPLVPIAHADTKGTVDWQGNNRTQFAFANLGAALNIYESSQTKLTSLTFGIGMNRIADFNSRTSFSEVSRYGGRPVPTIAEIYGQQLGQAEIFPAPGGIDDPLNGELRYEWIDEYGRRHRHDPAFWPAILGYNGYMINVENRGDGALWYPSFIGYNASVVHSLETVNSGSINEFSLSLGGNVNNIVYFGAAIGIQTVRKTSKVTYQEEYLYNGGTAEDGSGNPLSAQLDYSSLYQKTSVEGAGVNFKLGVTVRPTAGLRLGVAYHTPTFYSLDLAYSADIETLDRNNRNEQQRSYDRTPVQRDEGRDSYDFVSPSRLMFGASYTFGTFAILSVDYERDWYNGIRVKNLPNIGISTADYKWDYKHNFQATNTVRAGLEIRPLPILALRAGAGYTDSMLKERSAYINGPVAYESRYYSAGVGISLSRNVVLDLAYQYVAQKQTAYQLFFSYDPAADAMMTHSGLYDTKLTRHYAAMTLAFRF